MKPRDRLPIVACAVIGLLWVGSIGGLLGAEFATRPLLPDTIGLNQIEASKAIAIIGLLPIASERSCADLPGEACIVLDQEPIGGKVPRGAQVNLAMGPQTVVVPNLFGLSLEEADRLLDPLWLTASGSVVIPPELAATNRATADWKISTQSPAPGTEIKAGNAVVVAFERPDVIAPSLISLNPTDAGERALDVGLVVANSSSTIPLTAQVRTQSPKPGEVVKFGDVVELEYATRVPDIQGLDWARAKAEATQHGLVLVGGSQPDASIVSTQLPAPETLVELGTEISVTTAKYIPAVTAENWRSTLSKAGFVPVAEPANPGFDWRLLETDPAEGTLASPGTLVTVRFERPVKPTVTLSVSGNVSEAEISWTEPGSSSNRFTRVESLPWSKTWEVDEVPRYSFERGDVSVRVSGKASLKCTISVNGVVVTEDNDSSDYYTSAMCY